MIKKLLISISCIIECLLVSIYIYKSIPKARDIVVDVIIDELSEVEVNAPIIFSEQYNLFGNNET